jgi:two-component system sensor histidine kinase KdpD
LGLTVLAQIFNHFLSIQVIALLYLLPVVISARLWGFGPGILAAVSAFLCLNYFFVPPLYTLFVHTSQDLLALIVFLANAVIISQLLGRAQISVEAAYNREQEATRLYEFSTSISGQQDIPAIVQFMAEKITETLEPEGVGVLLNENWGKTVVYIPPQAVINRKPEVVILLNTARGEQGRIQFWRNIPLSDPELRILRTIANQGALAIERSGLAQVETRARVLEESDHLKSALLSSVSHELRTPLATIKASISTLRSDSVELDATSRADLLLAIEEETDHLNQLVGNILDMSRIETGALHPVRKWNALAEIVNGVVRRMRQSLHQHQIMIDIPTGFPFLPVDYVQMEQVFTNLLSNSAKFAPPNSQIKVSACVLPEQMVLVKVSNQGPPVAIEHLDRIFDKFYRVIASDKVTGTGLGLSICKGIIEAHGGRIWAENEPGMFVFNFTLPMNWEGASPQLPEET